MPIFECSRCNEPAHSASRESLPECPSCGGRRYRLLDGIEPGAPRDLRPGDHAGMVFDDPAPIAPFCSRYLTEGVDKGERVMAALTADLRRAVEALLAADVNVLVEWSDPLAVYGGDFDPDRVAAMYDELIGAEPRDVRILAAIDRECTDGVDPAETDRYEALAHAIVTRHGATALCLYDSRGMAEDYLAAARRRHPLAVVDGVPLRNPSFEYEPA